MGNAHTDSLHWNFSTSNIIIVSINIICPVTSSLYFLGELHKNVYFSELTNDVWIQKSNIFTNSSSFKKQEAIRGHMYSHKSTMLKMKAFSNDHTVSQKQAHTEAYTCPHCV